MQRFELPFTAERCSCRFPREDCNRREAAALNLMYRGFATMNVRGPATGSLYQFSGRQAVRQVDWRDASALLETRLFRQAP